MKHKEIAFNPWNNNPRDFIGKTYLVTPAGDKVTIKQGSGKWEVCIGSETVRRIFGCDDTCSYLNNRQVGYLSL